MISRRFGCCILFMRGRRPLVSFLLFLVRNFVDPKQVDRENAVFTQLMKERLPKIYETLTDKKVIYVAYTIKWFMTLYSGGVSQ